MIDERKMKKEIVELMQTAAEGTVEHRIYQIFLEYQQAAGDQFYDVTVL